MGGKEGKNCLLKCSNKKKAETTNVYPMDSVRLKPYEKKHFHGFVWSGKSPHKQILNL